MLTDLMMYSSVILGMHTYIIRMKTTHIISFPFSSDSGTRAFQFQDVFNIDNEGSDDMETLIDNKVILGSSSEFMQNLYTTL